MRSPICVPSSVLLSLSVWFCPQSWRLFTQQESERWQTVYLSCAVSVFRFILFFFVALADCFLRLALVTWTLPGVPQYLCLPGMGAAVERLSLLPSPLELNMSHDSAMLGWHMSSMRPGTQVMLKHECTGLLHSVIEKYGKFVKENALSFAFFFFASHLKFEYWRWLTVSKNPTRLKHRHQHHVKKPYSHWNSRKSKGGQDCVHVRLNGLK